MATPNALLRKRAGNEVILQIESWQMRRLLGSQQLGPRCINRVSVIWQSSAALHADVFADAPNKCDEATSALSQLRVRARAGAGLSAAKEAPGVRPATPTHAAENQAVAKH